MAERFTLKSGDLVAWNTWSGDEVQYVFVAFERGPGGLWWVLRDMYTSEERAWPVVRGPFMVNRRWV